MIKRKNHHYIPRFYLKRFSDTLEQKTVSLYNYVNGKHVSAAPIKSQCCEDYLYGKDDEVEDALAQLEAVVSKLFDIWIEKKELAIPPTPSGDGAITILKQFILYQLFRTPYAGEKMMSGLNDAFKKVLPIMEPEMVERINGGELVYENPTLVALGHAIDKEPLLNYLDFKFIVNLSKQLFITSDSPVICYNQYAESLGNYIGATAIASTGLQIFYPIHPRLMICFYDPQIYECGKTKHCIGTKKVQDIDNLNGMQYINSRSQLFFAGCTPRKYILSLIERFSAYKNTGREINEIIPVSGEKFMMFMGSESAHTNMKLSFFTLKRYPERIYPSLRHDSFYEITEQNRENRHR